MSTTDSDEAKREPAFSPSDIYQAASEGILSQDEAARLVSWGYERQTKESFSDGRDSRLPQSARKPNAETVACYVGAMLMIGATAWLLGQRWEDLGSNTILALSLSYAVIAGKWSRRLRQRGHTLRGGLLLTVAVSQVPLITYAIQDIFNFWPGEQAPQPYFYFYFMAHPSWVVMELATITCAIWALGRMRFSFLGAPLGFSCWLLARDLPLWLSGYPEVDFKKYLWLSAAVGLCTLLLGRQLSATDNKLSPSARTEDLAFWPYLFGTIALWDALSALTALSQLHISVYMLASLSLLAIGLRQKRKTFLVFGALGLDQTLRHLAYLSFPNSFFFPFVLIAIGAYLMCASIRAQRKTEPATV